MKVNYFGYQVTDANQKTSHVFDMRAFFKSFCAYPNNKYKSSFLRNQENIYLLHQGGDLFLFLTTRTTDIIQKINKNNLNVEDINALLRSDENIGFASYVMIKDGYLGFGSTVMAPRSTAFGDFVNNIFDTLGLSHAGYQFRMEAFLRQASKQEVLSMPFLGRTVVNVPIDKSAGKKLAGFFGGVATDLDDVASIEITIKPKPRQNIKKMSSKLLSSSLSGDADKLYVKGKEDELNGQAQDLYLIGSGALSDTVDTKKKSDVKQFMTDAIDNNKILFDKVKEFKYGQAKKLTAPSIISNYNNIAAWTNLMG